MSDGDKQPSEFDITEQEVKEYEFTESCLRRSDTLKVKHSSGKGSTKNTTLHCYLSNPNQTGTLKVSYEPGYMTVIHSSGEHHLKMTHELEEGEKFVVTHSSSLHGHSATTGNLKVLVTGEFAYCYLDTSNLVGYKYDISESNSHQWTIKDFPNPSTISVDDKCLAVRGSAGSYYVEGVESSGDTFSFSNQVGYFAISTTIKNQHKDEETFYLGPSSDGEKIIATKTDTPSYVFQFPGN